ncbi:DinB family protein [Neolewinella persica]|uniref:DinB family protein n=1 Tax=Neolewinella persica TaxID=70998 RepID=UPI00036EDAB1|nr:DinB family protein [Neolewinella persica]
MIPILRQLLQRDLTRLHDEISAYTSEANLWITGGEITNSGGNLCLHLVGNLNTFICGELGHSGYIRDRPAEFNTKNIPRETLLRQVLETRELVDQTLANLPTDSLDEVYSVQLRPEKMTTGYFLTHLAMHLSYHLGQVNYHRRMLDE